MPAWTSAPTVDSWRNAPPAAQPVQYDPSKGGSTLNLAGFDTGIPTSQGVDRFLSGMGSAVAGTGRGLGQLYNYAADAVSPRSPTLSGLVTGQDSSRSAASTADIDEAKRLEAPLMNTGAGIAGNIAGNVGMMAAPGAAVAKIAAPLGYARAAAAGQAFVNPTTYLGAAGASAVQGAIQPVGSDDSRLLNTGLGLVAGGAGQGVVNTLGRIAQPVQNALDPIRQKAVNALQAAGVPLNLGQVTGSPMWNRISSALNDNLFTVGGQQSFKDAQGQAYTRAASKLIGEDSPALTSDVMGRVLSRTNGVFQNVLSRNDVSLTPGLSSDLAAVQARAIENDKAPVSKIINRTFDAADPSTGTIPGQTAYNIIKDMREMSSGAGTDSTLRNLAGDARGTLLDGLNSGLSGNDLQAFAQARRQQAIMHTLEGALDKGGSGELSPNKLANIIGQKANRNMSVYGKGPQDLVDLAQSGKQILPDQTPNSGTTARLMAAFLPGAAVSVGTQLATGDPIEAAKYGLGTMALPKAAQWVLNNPTMVNALSRGIQNPVLRGALQAPAQNALVGQTVRNAPNALARMLIAP